MIENIALKIQKLILKIGSFLKINSDNIDQSQNIYNIYRPVFNSPVQSNQQDLITDEIKKFSHISSAKSKSDHKISLGNNLGVVIDPNLSGTTINSEFAISNQKSSPLIIKGISGELKGIELNFKGFFKLVDEGKQRIPDLSRRFPLLIAPNGADTYAVILENLDKELITKGSLVGKLLVLTGENEVIQKTFNLNVDNSLIKLIDDTRNLSKQRGLPFVFDVMIKS